MDASYGRGSRALEHGQAPDFVWFSYIDQVVGDAGAFFRRRLGCTDVHAPVKETRIRRDDLPIQPFSQFNGHPGLADRGWPDNDNEYWLVLVFVMSCLMEQRGCWLVSQ